MEFEKWRAEARADLSILRRSQFELRAVQSKAARTVTTGDRLVTTKGHTAGIPLQTPTAAPTATLLPQGLKTPLKPTETATQPLSAVAKSSHLWSLESSLEPDQLPDH